MYDIETFETYVSNIDYDYDADDTIFNIWVYKLDTTDLKMVNRLQYGIGFVF